MPQIEVQQLCKTFRVPEREGGLRAALGSLFRRRYKEVIAVDHIDLTIDAGEIVGFLGPNGAGKTTTLKMLTGLLHPTAGHAAVLGFTPYRREADFLSQISLLMGQRSQLNWDLPAMDSFLVQLAVYRVDRRQGQATLDELIDLLDLKSVLKKQVRTLSLGERMKCELCMSLLHRPRIVFLDEPTIGVDITMQARIRRFIAEQNRRYGTTVILTSHYMADVQALCRRIIVIDHGKLLFDGPLAALVEKLAPFKVIAIDLDRDVDGYDFARLGTVMASDPRKVTIRVARDEAASVTGRLLADLPVLDLTIQDPPIEDVIARAFAGGRERPAEDERVTK
jgi:ABC-2 type transport system ATP-binding protein